MAEQMLPQKIFTCLETFFHNITKIDIFDNLHINYIIKTKVCVNDEEQLIAFVKCLIDQLNNCLFENKNQKIILSILSSADLEAANISEISDEIENDVKKENSILQETLIENIANRFDGIPVEEVEDEKKVTNSIQKRHIKCPSCNKQFSTNTKLNYHLTKCSNSVVHSRQRFDVLPFFCCENCFGVSLSRESFPKHACCETNDTSTVEAEEQKIISNIEDLYRLNKFICLVCTEEYRSVSRMNYHLTKCKPPPYYCELCQEKFLSKRDLNAHKKRTHKGEDCYFCEECDLKFKLRTSLQKHQVKRHETNQGPYQCDVTNCAAVFSKRIHLTNHKISEHQLDREFLCQICGNKFCSKSSLTVHVQTHEQQKRFICQFCSKSFVQKEKLKYHERIHTGERPYVCVICSKAFIKKTKLDDHMKRHSQEKMYVCSFCSNSFSSNHSLKTHVKKEHCSDGEKVVSRNESDQISVADASQHSPNNEVVINDYCILNAGDNMISANSNTASQLQNLNILNQNLVVFPQTIYMAAINELPSAAQDAQFIATEALIKSNPHGM